MKNWLVSKHVSKPLFLIANPVCNSKKLSRANFVECFGVAPSRSIRRGFFSWVVPPLVIGHILHIPFERLAIQSLPNTAPFLQIASQVFAPQMGFPFEIELFVLVHPQLSYACMICANDVTASRNRETHVASVDVTNSAHKNCALCTICH